MPEQFRPRGVTMRDCSKNRAGFDRVLMAVAATFLTVSATSALAQTGPARNSPAELAIDAAIPRPEPANVPPPTVNDFKPDTAAPVPDAAEGDAKKAAETKPSDVVTAPAADTGKNDASKVDARKADTSKADAAKNDAAKIDTAKIDTAKNDTATTRPTGCGRRNAGRRARQGTGQGCKQRPAGRSAGRRQTARHAGRKIVALFRPQGRTGSGREVLHRARICAAVDARRHR